MIITIDGHAGSGKSTAARHLADALGFELLNTGAMYRATAHALTAAGIDIDADPRDAARIAALVGPFTFDLAGGRCRLNGTDLTDQIQSEDHGRAASRVGTFLEVRRKLQAEQRRLAADRNVICEGRDQGTVVFPDAPAKFFFTASAPERARRRAAELRMGDDPATLDRLAAQIAARDEQDEMRALDPLCRPAGAVVVDTSVLSPDRVLAAMLEAVATCHPPT